MQKPNVRLLCAYMNNSIDRKEAARLLGSSRSLAKTVAARRNALKGGRPRKRPSQSIRLAGFQASVLQAVLSAWTARVPTHRIRPLGAKLPPGALVIDGINMLANRAVLMGLCCLLREYRVNPDHIAQDFKKNGLEALNYGEKVWLESPGGITIGAWGRRERRG